MATLTNIAKNRYIPGSGGAVFFGWMFLFTTSIPGSGPSLRSTPKHTASLINVAKH